MFRVARSGCCVCVTLTVRCSFTAEPGGPPVSARVCLSVVRAFRPGVDVPALRLSRVRGVCVVRTTCAGGCGWSEQRVRRCRGGAERAACAPLSRPTSSPSFGDASYYYYVFDNLVSEARRQGVMSCLSSARPDARPLAGWSAFGLALSRHPPGARTRLLRTSRSRESLPLPHWGAG